MKSDIFGSIILTVISPFQDEMLKLFPSLPDSSSFYLTRGTALAHFYLQHRKSYDLDFFTSEEHLIDPFSRRFEALVQSQSLKTDRRRSLKSFVEIFVIRGEETCVIQFAQDSPFRFEPPQEFPAYPGLKVDSLREIASNKVLALFGRAALRDFIDLYVLIHEAKFDPKRLMKEAQQKDQGFDLYWFGVALERINSYTAESQEMLMLLKPISFSSLQSFFNDWRRKVSESLLK